MAQEKATWRKIIDGVDEVVGPRLTELTKTKGFKDSLGVVGNVTNGIKAQVERRSRQWLHLWNLPAGSDVKRLQRQIVSLDHEVRRLRAQLTTAAIEDDEPDVLRPVRSTGAKSRGARDV